MMPDCNLASSDRDRNQAFRVGERAWGVQFHPEFDGEVMRAYVALYREALVAEGQDVARIEKECADTPESAYLLKRFREMIERD